MKITPQTESAVMEAGLLPAGIYPFSIQSAVEKVSKNGNPMIAMQLEVYDADGRGRKVNDYLMESVAYKLRHFAYAVGLGSRYESGTLEADEFTGLAGKCQIKIEPAKDGFNAKNTVKDYCKPDAVVENTAAPTRPASASNDDSELPPF